MKIRKDKWTPPDLFQSGDYQNEFSPDLIDEVNSDTYCSLIYIRSLKWNIHEPSSVFTSFYFHVIQSAPVFCIVITIIWKWNGNSNEGQKHLLFKFGSKGNTLTYYGYQNQNIFSSFTFHIARLLNTNGNIAFLSKHIYLIISVSEAVTCAITRIRFTGLITLSFIDCIVILIMTICGVPNSMQKETLF